MMFAPTREGGRPVMAKREESDRFSASLLEEYRSTDITYRKLADKYRVSLSCVFRRIQLAMARAKR
jgi:hypothetical protein